jgi:hypothetical protein
MPSAASLVEDASDETTPNACGHVHRLAADEVKREVAVYICVAPSFHAVAHRSVRWDSFFPIDTAKNDYSNAIVLLSRKI